MSACRFSYARNVSTYRAASSSDLRRAAEPLDWSWSWTPTTLAVCELQQAARPTASPTQLLQERVNIAALMAMAAACIGTCDRTQHTARSQRPAHTARHHVDRMPPAVGPVHRGVPRQQERPLVDERRLCHLLQSALHVLRVDQQQQDARLRRQRPSRGILRMLQCAPCQRAPTCALAAVARS